MRNYLFLLLPLLTTLAAQAQVRDTSLGVVDTVVIGADHSIVVEESLAAREYHPRQALLWSIIPGGGQVYNRRWWKVPLVYSAFTGMLFAIDYNQGNYNRILRAYRAKLKGEPHEFTGTRLDDLNPLRVLRDDFDKNRQLAYVGLVLVYALQGIEAFVDTHLRNFDIDDDLTLRVQPRLLAPAFGGGPTVGIAVVIGL